MALSCIYGGECYGCMQCQEVYDEDDLKENEQARLDDEKLDKEEFERTNTY